MVSRNAPEGQPVDLLVWLFFGDLILSSVDLLLRVCLLLNLASGQEHTSNKLCEDCEQTIRIDRFINYRGVIDFPNLPVRP